MVRRPAAIQPSISRRDPRPRSASTFWTRCGSAVSFFLIGIGSGGSRLQAPRRPTRTSAGRSPWPTMRSASAHGLAGSPGSESPSSSATPSSSTSRSSASGAQLVEVLQSEVVEKLTRRSIERRTAGNVAHGRPARIQRRSSNSAEDARAQTHAAHVLDVCARVIGWRYAMMESVSSSARE